MKKIGILVTIVALIAFVGCKENKSDKEETVVEEVEEIVNIEPEIVEKKISLILESKSGSSAAGKVSFTEENGMVKMSAKISGLTPGMHAIHIHEKADCSSPDGKSSGGHWNPTKVQHGAWGDEAGYHKGDIGNFEADENGVGTVSMETNEWCIGCGDESKDILGKAIIVHQGVDDFKTQPTGDAGGRVSCGGIIQ
jgi:Cu-Zn family superoxide dismutase